MKKILKTTSEISIISFGILFIIDKVFDFNFSKNGNIKSLLVIIYLASTMIYNKMELKDRNARIQELKIKLKKTNNKRLI